jgi:hypothetical protein
MSFKTLDVASGSGGGAQQLARVAKYPRCIHVTVYNLDVANPHCAFFGRSRRELVLGPTGIPGGFALPVPAAVAPAAGNGIQYAPGEGFFSAAGAGGVAAIFASSFVLQGWAGELWAAADASNKVQIEVIDAAATEA